MSFQEAEDENWRPRIYLDVHWQVEADACIAQGNEINRDPAATVQTNRKEIKQEDEMSQRCCKVQPERRPICADAFGYRPAPPSHAVWSRESVTVPSAPLLIPPREITRVTRVDWAHARRPSPPIRHVDHIPRTCSLSSQTGRAGPVNAGPGRPRARARSRGSSHGRASTAWPYRGREARQADW